MTNYKSHGLGLIVVAEVHTRVAYILDCIIFLTADKPSEAMRPKVYVNS